MDPTYPETGAPRVLRIELGQASGAPILSATRELPRTTPWSRVASLGGSGLAVALVGAELERDLSARPLTICVGAAVRRGVPTAARAVVGGFAPLTGRYGEGQVGGELGPRLAAVLDGLLVVGALDRTACPGAVLVLDGSGAAQVRTLGSSLARGTVVERLAQIRSELGPGATLVCGPAGDRGVAFATLASGGPPSFVGRGGLGATLGATGLVAVHITAEPVAAEPDVELDRLLASSPRLVHRASGGGFEQALGAAVRGATVGADGGTEFGDTVRSDAVRSDTVRSDTEYADSEDRGPKDEGGEGEDRVARAAAFGEVWKARRDGRVGCRGCPTPCGFVFDAIVGSGAGVRGHFGATRSLGGPLGLDDPDDVLTLLRRCDEMGLDAKETGSVLALLCDRAEASQDGNGPRRGDLRALDHAVERLAHDEVDGTVDPEFERARAGSLRLIAPAVKGAVEGERPRGPATPRHDLAALALAVGAGAGTDPMRSYPFGTDIGRERLQALLGPATGPLPAHAERPDSVAAKGLMAWWHESLVAGLDASGFCVFSATGLLADGICDLDGLASRLEPGRDGKDLLAAGASVVLARAQVSAMLARPLVVPGWARHALSNAVIREYRAARGVDEDGFPRSSVLERIGTRALGIPVDVPEPPSPASALHERPAFEQSFGAQARTGSPPTDAGATTPWTDGIIVRAFGPLAQTFGGELRVPLSGATTLLELLERCAKARPAARARLLGDAGPSAWSGGRRLELSDPVEPGRRIDLLSALAGG